MSRIDMGFDQSQVDFGKSKKVTNPLTPSNLLNAQMGNDTPEQVNDFARFLKQQRNTRRNASTGDDPLSYLKKEVWNYAKSGETLKPVTKNVTKVLAQYLDQVAVYRFDEPVTIMEFGLKEKVVVRGIPSESKQKNGLLNAVEVESPDGKKRKYRRVNPAHIADSKILQDHIDKIQSKVDMKKLEEFAGNEPNYARWVRLLREKRDEDLWIPVDANTGNYLPEELDLEHQLRIDLAMRVRPDNALRYAQKYKDTHTLWREIAQQESRHQRVTNAESRLKRSHDPAREVKFVEPSVPNKKDSGTASANKLRQRVDLLESNGAIMQTGQEYKDVKKEKQDYIWVGRNRAGQKAFSLYDGVSNVGDRKDGIPYKNRSGNLAKFMGNAVRKTRSGSMQELRRVADRALRRFKDLLSHDERAAATGVAAVLDEKNTLRVHMRGDVAVYVYRDGQIERVTPIQNEKTRKLYEIMEERGVTKAAAREILKKEFKNLDNSPNMYRSDDPNDNNGFEFSKRLRKGDIVMFFSDGVFDHTQTRRAEVQLLIDAAESNNPAEFLISEANRLHEQYKPGGHKDDYSAGFMRVN